MAVRRFVTLGLMLVALGAGAEQLMPTPEDAVPRDPNAASGPSLMPPPQGFEPPPAPAPVQPEPPDNNDYSAPPPSSDE